MTSKDTGTTVPPHLAQNPFQDLSGVDASAFKNPYDALLHITENDTTKLQERYSAHRTTRNAQQKAKLLNPNFAGVIVDPILAGLEDTDGRAIAESGFVDPRHCLVFWGRPPQRIKRLIGAVQQRLRGAVPHLWLMPLDKLHITILEITHSKSAEEIELLKKQIEPHADLVNYTQDSRHRAKLIKPLIGFDASALALSFVPAAGDGDAYSYHHLRRDCFTILDDAGIKVDSRYVVPSAHLTIGRFITQRDLAKEDGSMDLMKMELLIKAIEDINAWLGEQYWSGNEPNPSHDGEWTVGEETGLHLRWGTVWYGGGESMAVGKGF